MRCNEPLRLDRGDTDLVDGVLTVRDTKFGKSRYVPLHPSTQHALKIYAASRDRSCPNPLSASFFLSERGTRLTERAVRWTFVKLSREVGLRGSKDSHGPRLHDLGHRLAVTTLLGIATASMSNATCPSWRPISAMPTSPTPIGI
ncbi:tyrosine-type recombinase/integrase [Mesorhizobium sp.]|uniref:tyrosine-type recombinase/integrase n=1 Tax=Mesorhizobium sp. TaxID=1871066 RepID=UPI00257CFD12|nr:tyrosine-type recombinase/integrase [Mesorhizobium sp.]